MLMKLWGSHVYDCCADKSCFVVSFEIYILCLYLCRSLLPLSVSASGASNVFVFLIISSGGSVCVVSIFMLI